VRSSYNVRCEAIKVHCHANVNKSSIREVRKRETFVERCPGTINANIGSFVSEAEDNSIVSYAAGNYLTPRCQINT